MAEISKMTLLNGTTYDLKDTNAQETVAELQEKVTGPVNYSAAALSNLLDYHMSLISSNEP